MLELLLFLGARIMNAAAVFFGGGYAYILPATTDTDVLSADRDIQGYSTLETRSHWLLISVKLLGLPVTVRLW